MSSTRALPCLALPALLLTTLVFTSTGTALAEAPRAGEWELLRTKDGIAVKRRKNEGQPLHEFQGRGIVEAPIARVLAVMDDDAHRPEWSERCMESRTVERIGDWVTIMYDRTGAPWPVAHRDVVIRATLSVDTQGGAVHIDFQSTSDPRVPPVKGVVRMPKLEGHWYLWPAHNGEWTEVEYQVHADPGGTLPDWITNLVSKMLPYKTLMGLRKQVTNPRYDAMAQQIMSRPEYRAVSAGAAK